MTKSTASSIRGTRARRKSDSNTIGIWIVGVSAAVLLAVVLACPSYSTGHCFYLEWGDIFLCRTVLLFDGHQPVISAGRGSTGYALLVLQLLGTVV